MEIINSLSWDMNAYDSSTSPWYDHIEIVFTDPETGYPEKRFLKSIEWCKMVHPDGPWALDWEFMDETNMIANAFSGIIHFEADATVRDVMSSIAALTRRMGNFDGITFDEQRTKEIGVSTYMLHWAF